MAVSPYLRIEMDRKEVGTIVRNYFYDGMLVQALRDPYHPDHARQWQQVRRWCLAKAMKAGWRQEDAEDIAQKTLLHIHRSLSDFRFESRFSYWVNILVTNVINDWLRKQKRRLPVVEADDAVLENIAEKTEVFPDPDKTTLYSERIELLGFFLRRVLSSRDLLILRLFLAKDEVVNGAGQKQPRLTDADIARRVGLKAGSIPNTRKRIYQHLAKDPLLRQLVAELFGPDYLNDEDSVRKESRGAS